MSTNNGTTKHYIPQAAADAAQCKIELTYSGSGLSLTVLAEGQSHLAASTASGLLATFLREREEVHAGLVRLSRSKARDLATNTDGITR